ncbi:hypothetical protein TTHERM_00327380 (macronuclear) [Tetrahymena thermophila SB210]|uniref:Kinase domain protein n=1 Tax=Tetrahymena thermophila (strain SB210) TaxID=312017 RepID=I7LXV3_TETTS|nr:hypothetical protein TTHERM_00327380 [Tetrahymena thermophila SB210]EAS06256.3 hypothetical protein TTHERM_00327380 [Tetrahymena thermophila SB210]|eukprot:XP_001026501.3 hypothetical protein TTHERM_00327380 [Tetrahymena thermophila SB210]
MSKTNRELYEYLKLLRAIKIKPYKMRFVTISDEIGISFTQIRNLKNQDVIQELLLDMQYTQLPCESAIGISSKVSKLPNLKSISLNFTDCQLLGNKGFQGVVVKLFRVAQLEEVSLIFNQCKLESEAIQHLDERIGQLSKLKKLTLGFRQNNLTDSNLTEIGQALNKCKTLESIDIDLSYNSSLQNPSEKSLDLSELTNLQHFSINIQASKIKSPKFLQLPVQLEILSLNFITVSPFNQLAVLDTFKMISGFNSLKSLNLMIHNQPFCFNSFGQEQIENENDENEEQEQQDENEEEEEKQEESAIINEDANDQNSEVEQKEENKDKELLQQEKYYKDIQDSLFENNSCLEQLNLQLTFKQSGVGNIMSKLLPIKTLKSLHIKNRFGTALNTKDVENLRALIRNNQSLNSISLKFSQNQVNVQELNSIIEDLCASDRWIYVKLDLSQTVNFQWENTLAEMANQFIKLKNLQTLSLNLSSNNIDGEDLVTFTQRINMMQSLISLKLNLRGNNITVNQSNYVCFSLRQLGYLAKLKLQLGVLSYQSINEDGEVETQTTINESVEYKKLQEFIKERESNITRIALFDNYFREAIPFNPNILICDFYF